MKGKRLLWYVHVKKSHMSGGNERHRNCSATKNNNRILTKIRGRLQCNEIVIYISEILWNFTLSFNYNSIQKNINWKLNLALTTKKHSLQDTSSAFLQVFLRLAFCFTSWNYLEQFHDKNGNNFSVPFSAS